MSQPERFDRAPETFRELWQRLDAVRRRRFALMTVILLLEVGGPVALVVLRSY